LTVILLVDRVGMKRAAGVAVIMPTDQRGATGTGYRSLIPARNGMGMMPAAPKDAVEQHREECDQAGDSSAHEPRTIQVRDHW
jgi:hypothetical protein